MSSMRVAMIFMMSFTLFFIPNRHVCAQMPLKIFTTFFLFLVYFNAKKYGTDDDDERSCIHLDLGPHHCIGLRLSGIVTTGQWWSYSCTGLCCMWCHISSKWGRLTQTLALNGSEPQVDLGEWPRRSAYYTVAQVQITIGTKKRLTHDFVLPFSLPRSGSDDLYCGDNCVIVERREVRLCCVGWCQRKHYRDVDGFFSPRLLELGSTIEPLKRIQMWNAIKLWTSKLKSLHILEKANTCCMWNELNGFEAKAQKGWTIMDML